MSGLSVQHEDLFVSEEIRWHVQTLVQTSCTITYPITRKAMQLINRSLSQTAVTYSSFLFGKADYYETFRLFGESFAKFRLMFLRGICRDKLHDKQIFRVWLLLRLSIVEDIYARYCKQPIYYFISLLLGRCEV